MFKRLLKFTTKKFFAALLCIGAVFLLTTSMPLNVGAAAMTPVELLSDTNIANGIRAFELAASFTLPNQRGDIATYKSTGGKQINLLPHTNGDMNESDHYWWIQEGVHKDYTNEQGQYISELFDHRFNIRYSNLINTPNQLSFENTNYSGQLIRRFTSDKNGKVTLYYNSKNEIRNTATYMGGNPNDTWPTYLITQDFKNYIDFSNYDKVELTFDAKLSYANRLDGWTNVCPIDGKIHEECTNLMYFFLQEKDDRYSSGSPSAAIGNGWFGVALYAAEFYDGIENVNPVTYPELFSMDQWGIPMYRDDGANWGGRLSVGNTVKYKVDLKKLLAKALEKAKSQGKAMKASPDDYLIREINFGYEMTGYWETEIEYSKISIKGYSTGDAMINKSWDFNGSTTEGWYNFQNTTVSTGSGALNIAISGTCPGIVSPDFIGINATTNKYVRVKLKNPTASNIAHLYWVTNSDGNWDAIKSKNISIANNTSDYTEYVFDMSDIGSWAGTIRALRLDMYNVSSGTAYIDNILISDDPYAINSKSWDFNNAGNLEGWGSPHSSSLSVNDGYLKVIDNGAQDPYFYSPDNLDIDASSNKYAKVKLNNEFNNAASYEFDSGSLSGWSIGNNTNLDSSGGVLTASITGSDSYIYSPNNLGLTASDFNYIRMMLKNNSTSKLGKMYFITESDQTWNEAKSVQFYMDGSMPGYKEFICDCYHNTNWIGTIKQIRIDFDDTFFPITSGSINLDYIRFANSALNALYWTTNSDQIWNSAKSIAYRIEPGETGSSEYIVDLSGNASWTDTIKQIRFDPVNDGSSIHGYQDIDYIRISR